jgi:pimeloyl-ACP methyl ester carboxylesterase
VDAAGLDRFSLLGISRGGAIAIAYTVKHPERVNKLVLYGAFPMGLYHYGSPEELEAPICFHTQRKPPSSCRGTSLGDSVAGVLRVHGLAQGIRDTNSRNRLLIGLYYWETKWREAAPFVLLRSGG